MKLPHKDFIKLYFFSPSCLWRRKCFEFQTQIIIIFDTSEITLFFATLTRGGTDEDF